MNSLRRRVYDVIEVGRGEHQHSQLFDTFLIVIILANILAFCAETVPDLAAEYGDWFHAFELFSVAVFTVEYVLRVWTAVEVPFLSRLPPLKARLMFMRRPLEIIDLLAFLPFYLGHLFGLDLRVLRAFRLLRLFKLTRYSPAVHTLYPVLYNERRPLTGAVLLLLIALLFSSTGMYFIKGHAQPEKFGSVPLSAYWALTTLTTVGYGDVVPITPLGKLWSMLTMLFGLCVLALPVAIISTGFAQEVGRRDFVVTWSLMARVPLSAGLEASEVTDVLPMLHAVHTPPGVEIVPAGSDGIAMFFVASGHVRQIGPGYHCDYRTGDVFGVVSFLDQSPNPGRYIAVSRCRLLKLYREDFQRLQATKPELGRLIRAIGDERRTARQQTQTTAANET